MLVTLGGVDDTEAVTKALIVEGTRDAKAELSRFELTIKSMIENMEEALEQTETWLKDNHDELTDSVKKVEEDLRKKHLQKGKIYLIN